MEKYEATEGFIDEVEKNAYRKAGEPFKVGLKTDKKRLEELSTDKNKQKRPLIKKVVAARVKKGE